MRLYYIYTITNNINGKIYVGQSYNPKDRWSTHKSEARSTKANRRIYPIYLAMRKYGMENFQFSIIDQCDSPTRIDELEENWMIKLKSREIDYGYNIAKGGLVPMRGRHHTEETKQKLREKHKLQIFPRGYRQSSERIKQMSEVARRFDDETEYKMVELRKSGKTLNEIANIYNCCVSIICEMMKRRGIKIDKRKKEFR